MKSELAKIIGAAMAVLTGAASCSPRVAVNHFVPADADLKSIHQPTSEQRAVGITQPFRGADVDFMT